MKYIYINIALLKQKYTLIIQVYRSIPYNHVVSFYLKEFSKIHYQMYELKLLKRNKQHFKLRYSYNSFYLK